MALQGAVAQRSSAHYGKTAQGAGGTISDGRNRKRRLPMNGWTVIGVVATLVGSTAQDQTQALPLETTGFGKAVASIPDVDGDSVADLIVGSPSWTKEKLGSVWLFSGATQDIMLGISEVDPGGRFGSSVLGVPDVDGDGIPDIVVASPSKGAPGYVALFSGANGERIMAIEPTEPGGQFGNSLAFVPAAGESPALLAIGSPQKAGRGGYVLLYDVSAKAPLRTIAPGERAPSFGQSLECGPDLDGDGVRDLFIGAPREGAGRVHVMSSLTGQELRVLEGSTSAERFGTSIASFGGSVAVGSPQYSKFAKRGGTVRVFSVTDGAIGLDYGDREHVRDQEWCLFGTSLAAVGDIDADGVSDLVTSAPNGDMDSLGRRGWTAALSTKAEIVLHTSSWGGELAGDLMSFGAALCAMGDVNGDGVPDYAVGAPEPFFGGVQLVSGERAQDSDKAAVLGYILQSDKWVPTTTGAAPRNLWEQAQSELTDIMLASGANRASACRAMDRFRRVLTILDPEDEYYESARWGLARAAGRCDVRACKEVLLQMIEDPEFDLNEISIVHFARQFRSSGEPEVACELIREGLRALGVDEEHVESTARRFCEQ